MDLCHGAHAGPPKDGGWVWGKRRSRCCRFLLFAFVAGFGFARCGDLSGDEILCEEAVGKLADCCGNTTELRSLRCVYDPGGCGPPKRPNISHEIATCLLDRSCQELVNQGTCQAEGWTSEEECGNCADSTSGSGTSACCSTWKEPTCSQH